MGSIKPEGIASRTMVLFFMADTSWSMDGKKIGTLNEAIKNVIPEIQEISDNNADAKIKIAAMKFSNGAEWLYPTPIEAENFKWKYLNTDGLTDFGTACKMLNEGLSRKEETGGFMYAASGSFAPAIFLLSDGEPTDEYHNALEQLKNNNWFKNAIKIAIAIGDDANVDVLTEFTGSKEAVITVHTPEALGKLIRFVAVTSSQIGSKSQDASATGTTKQAAVIEQVQDYVADQLNDSGEDEW
jgi:uncharacterized protein YegL